MAGKADVQKHLENRREALETTFAEWGKGDLDAADRAALIEQYFASANVGSPQRIGVSGSSVLVKSRRTDSKRANVLVLGRHDTSDLSNRRVDRPLDSEIVGPGLASRLGPTMAFCEGVLAAKEVTVEEPLNISYLSVGDDDSYAEAISHVFTGNLDAVFLTNATQWSPSHPTITTGCRGEIVAELTLTAGRDIEDFQVSGGLRNPLTKMTQMLGALRDGRGRIVLPGFYDRAHRPLEAARTALQADGHDADDWARSLPIAALGGTLPSLERAAIWPGVSVLSVETSSADGVTAPGVVRATVAFYLIPDQRHAEVERSLRAWFEAEAPADLQPQVRLVRSARPFRCEEDSHLVAAQSRAAARLFGRDAIIVPAGGPAGAGEFAYSLGLPVAFAGIASPSSTTGTETEHLAWSDFVHGTAMAAETALQLRRL